MNETASAPPNPLSAKRIILILLAGFVLGTIAGGTVYWNQRIVYTGLAVLKSPEHSGHAKRITRFRAEMITRELDLHSRLGITFDKAVADLTDSITLRPLEQGVAIEARSLDGRMSEAIARAAAISLETPRREKEMAEKALHLAPYTDAEEADRGTARDLERLLREQAVEAGFSDPFEVVELAAAGDAKASALANGEDFARRWAMMKELSEKVSHFNPLGEPLHRAKESPIIGEIPVILSSPSAAEWMNRFRIPGIALALLIIAALLRWKPAFLRPYPAKGPEPHSPRKDPAESDSPW